MTEQQEQDSERLATTTAGLLILDSSLHPLYMNGEAVKILAFPDGDIAKSAMEKPLLQKIRSVLPQNGAGSLSFQSGRRRYICRSFPVSPISRKEPASLTAVLIERHCEQLDLLQMAEDFHLTHREVEAVQFLALGLTSKEIATRMRISPNTVKAFLRLVMIKTGVTTRSGIIGRFLQNAQPVRTPSN